MSENVLRGCAFMLLASLLFSTSDATAKYVTQAVPAVELATIRYVVFVSLAASPLLFNRRVSMRSRRPWLQVLRGVGVVGSAICFILSLHWLPVAEATAINFITPLLITALAVPVLGEVVSVRGWAAVGVGFAGMLVVVRPGAGGLHPAALLVLLSSAFWCMAMLVTRRLAGTDRSAVTLLWTAGTGLALLLCAEPFFFQAMTLRQFGLCVFVGLVASGGQWFAILAYRHATATVLAPLSYAQLIWASILGLLIFGHLPDRFVYLGAVVIAASGIYIVHLERVRVAALRTGTELQLLGKPPGHDPAGKPGNGSADADQQETEIDAGQHHGDANAEQHAANQAA